VCTCKRDLHMYMQTSALSARFLLRLSSFPGYSYEFHANAMRDARETNENWRQSSAIREKKERIIHGAVRRGPRRAGEKE
jgi:hypothetical protein